jgi:hypothetical protein
LLVLLLLELDELCNLLLGELLLVGVDHVVVVLTVFQLLVVVFLIIFDVLLPSLNVEFVFCIRIILLVVIVNVFFRVLLVINHKLIVVLTLVTILLLFEVLLLGL